MKLQPDEFVVYRSAGVCRVLSEESQSPDGVTQVMYYKLKPESDPNSTYYVPVAMAEEKLRRLLTREEVLELIDNMPLSADEEEWLDNRRERKEMYSRIIGGDDQKALVNLIASLYFRKQSSEASGKRFSSMDESAMKNAEQLMLQEFGIVLGMPAEEVRTFIDERVQKHRT
ncbi:MAG: CarD family transcriptional regulator [Oscillospiraceae bacterium]|nr:CarD family transcriptional regulator [Oscillospiraceae bacterium]